MAHSVKSARKPAQDISTLTGDIEAFLAHCRAKGLSPKTVERHYAWSLHKLLIPFAERQGIKTSAQVTRPALDELARELHGRSTLSSAAIRTYLKGVNQFMGWVDRDGPRAPLPKRRKVDRDVLTPQEMRNLEAAAPYARDQIIIRLMAETGMREGEVASITVADIVQTERVPVVVVRGKTGERRVPVSAELHSRLRSLSKARPEGLTTKRLFLSLRAAPGSTVRPLSGNAIYQVVKQAAARLKLERRVYPHLLRHSAITRMVARGLHPATISEITGVSATVIAQHYSHVGLHDRYDALMRSLQED